ncbi:2-isopropylmalate synthase [Escherichia coli]|nr:2-isopropylmalate synthase [Escherichia coli]
MFDYDLEALAFIGKQQEEPEHLRLDYFSETSGSNAIPPAAVHLGGVNEVKGETPKLQCLGDCRHRGVSRQKCL